jgi:hypothetical protein
MPDFVKLGARLDVVIITSFELRGSDYGQPNGRKVLRLDADRRRRPQLNELVAVLPLGR